MFRELMEVGASMRSRIQPLCEPDATPHWERCKSEGLQCALEVFDQLFHEQANNEDFAVIAGIAGNLVDGVCTTLGSIGNTARTR
jgi:hypothetical protein